MYLTQVSDGKLPVNHPIIYQLQDVFNLLPNLNVPDLMKAFTVKTNDQNLVSFVVGVLVCVVDLFVVNVHVGQSDLRRIFLFYRLR